MNLLLLARLHVTFGGSGGIQSTIPPLPRSTPKLIMHRGLQELEDMDPRDRERMMMEEIERLQHENRDLRELREYDREHMQHEIRDLRQRIDGFSCQDTPKAGSGQMPLKC